MQKNQVTLIFLLISSYEACLIILHAEGTCVTRLLHCFYLFGDAVIGVRWHARGDVENDFHSGGSIVRSCKACAAIPLKASHKATMCGQVHLKDRVGLISCCILRSMNFVIGVKEMFLAPPIQVQTQSLRRPGCQHCWKE